MTYNNQPMTYNNELPKIEFHALEGYRSVFAADSSLVLAPAAEMAGGGEGVAPLWAPFWHEGEICILFSETNVGKSIVSVQIAHDLSRGVNSLTGAESRGRRVLYVDYELSDLQFGSRYSEAPLSPLFMRGRPREDEAPADEESLESAMTDIMDAMADGYEAIIIDNITYLSNAIKDSTAALRLMKALKARSRLTGCSLLLIAHTPKRQSGRPITKADIAGSSNLLNFADSAFAMGRSALDPSLRYLKQIKVRAGEFVHDADNVLVGRLDSAAGMLQFVPIVAQKESLHL